MGLDFGTGYDLLVVLWGTVFILAAVGFILAMNRVFTTEERRQDRLSEESKPQTLGSNH